MSRSVSRTLSLSRRFSSAQLDERGPKIFDGYIFKKGKYNTGYQKRWFVLYSNNTLAYFQDKFSSEDIALGDINLYSVTNIKEEGNNTFRLITAKRKFILKCDVKDELDEWIKKIKLRVSPNIICSGWLHKTGSNNRSFKLRYFKLCEYELHYEARYYEDEKCTKYKGKINCDNVEDIKILPNSSLKTYGKDLVLELITAQRTYVVAATDTKTRNIWYKSFKKAVYAVDDDRGKEKEKEKYEQQRFKEQMNEAEIFDTLSTVVLSQSIKEEAHETIKDAIINNDDKSIEIPQVKQQEAKPETQPIDHLYPYHYQKSPEPFTTSSTVTKPPKPKKNKDLDDDFGFDFFDEAPIEKNAKENQSNGVQTDEFNPIKTSDPLQAIQKDENVDNENINYKIEDKYDPFPTNDDEFEQRESRNNTTIVHHESDVFSKEFLEADYEDPSYGLLDHGSTNKQRISKCCNIL